MEDSFNEKWHESAGCKGEKNTRVWYWDAYGSQNALATKLMVKRRQRTRRRHPNQMTSWRALWSCVWGIIYHPHLENSSRIRFLFNGTKNFYKFLPLSWFIRTNHYDKEKKQGKRWKGWDKKINPQLSFMLLSWKGQDGGKKKHITFKECRNKIFSFLLNLSFLCKYT